MQLHGLLIFTCIAAFNLAADSPDTRVIETVFQQPDITVKDVDACVIGEVHPQSERFFFAPTGSRGRLGLALRDLRVEVR